MYQNIHKLPLTVFIDILISKDLTLLVTAGTATEEQLTERWEFLYSEYLDAIKSPEMMAGMETLKDSAIIQSKINRAKLLLDLIATMPDEQLINLLYDFDYPLPMFNGENHVLIIERFIAYYKNDFIDLQVMAAEQPQTSVSIDYAYFNSTIVDMSVGMKCSISLDGLTVGAYCSYVNKYRQFTKKPISDDSD